MPASALARLAADPDVAYISPDRPLQGLLDQADAAIGASAAATYGLTGAGVGVAVIDSGIGPSDDLSGKVVYEQQFVSNTNAQDAFGHGTHVAGIIAGSGLDSTGSKYTRTFHGVAEGVSLIDLQVLNSTGAGTDSSVIAAIQEAIALKSKYNIKVINLSLGRPVFESYKLDPLCQAVESAWKAGITVVVAAGNYGRDEPDHDLRLRHDYGSGQRPVRNHRRRREGPGNRDADRRPHRHLQFEGTDAVRHGRQAGSGGAGQSDRFDPRPGEQHGQQLSAGWHQL